jgi:predicted N-formylglutamate amidohydrolase
MTSNTEFGLLTSRDAGPVEITNHDGRSLFLLLGDHARNRVPERLASLGLTQVDLERHIALDIGVGALGQYVSRELDAPFIAQRYSRLVIDCNRALSHPDSIAAESDGTVIPANSSLTASQRQARAYAIHLPYHEAIADLLAARDRDGRATIVVSLHSFTPSFAGIVRPWQVGVLYGGGKEEFAKAVLAALSRQNLIVGENLPYQFDETDFTIPRHAFASARPYVELEVRQDTLERSQSIAKIGKLLSQVLRTAATMIEVA